MPLSEEWPPIDSGPVIHRNIFEAPCDTRNACMLKTRAKRVY